MALRRLMKEKNELHANPIEGVTADVIEESDMFKWQASISGPTNSPYEGGTFFLRIDFPVEYPFKPPKVNFTTKVYHPNVNENGGVCLDILADQWAPTLSISKVLVSIQQFLADPNPDHALVPEVAELMKRDPEGFKKKAKDWTKQYAM